jgi:twitching motility protein PilT
MSASEANKEGSGDALDLLEFWMKAVVESEASDLILRAGKRACCRIDGAITFLKGDVPPAEGLVEVLRPYLGQRNLDIWMRTGNLDASVSHPSYGRYRLNAFRNLGDPAAVLRKVADTAPDLTTLDLPTKYLSKLVERKRGLVLVTGIAGSGKSTTLSAMIQHLNTTKPRHVITLEDPVEILYKEERCVISQRELGTDFDGFQQGLSHALRQSPDVILIGEMRDAETVAAALDAAETGHMVLSTLHTVNAARTLDRILSFFPARQHSQICMRLSDNLAGIVSQRLVPRRGLPGLIPAIELLTTVPRVKEILLDGETVEVGRLLAKGGLDGLISFNESLAHLVEQGLVEMDVALAASDRPEELTLALRGFSSGTKSRLRMA